MSLGSAAKGRRHVSGGSYQHLHARSSTPFGPGGLALENKGSLALEDVLLDFGPQPAHRSHGTQNGHDSRPLEPNVHSGLLSGILLGRDLAHGHHDAARAEAGGSGTLLGTRHGQHDAVAVANQHRRTHEEGGRLNLAPQPPHGSRPSDLDSIEYETRNPQGPFGDWPNDGTRAKQTADGANVDGAVAAAQKFPVLFEDGTTHRYTKDQLLHKFGGAEAAAGTTVQHATRGRGTVLAQKGYAVLYDDGETHCYSREQLLKKFGLSQARIGAMPMLAYIVMASQAGICTTPT